jgi:hypothetical protein
MTKFTITYVREGETRKVVIEAETLKEAMRSGYQQYSWDSVLEVESDSNRPIQTAR